MMPDNLGASLHLVKSQPVLRRIWGALPVCRNLWRFGLWAPSARRVEVEICGRYATLTRGPDGVFSGQLGAVEGEAYRFIVDGAAIPDPASREQMASLHGPSRLHDPERYHWGKPWAGRPWEEAVIYELHIGLFTHEGTFLAAARHMKELADLGITAIEIMPVAQFAGRRGWGYDGVMPFAPHPAYGTPDELRELVETAHEYGLMVLLDVVFNHFGPEGAVMHAIAPEFFDGDRATPWGPGIDYSQPAVRAFYIEAALMWLGEYRLDGLRLDAVHQIVDRSTPDLVTELSDAVEAAGFDRPIHLIAEDERNLPDHREKGVICAAWNDDYHHAIHCLLTGEALGYYAPFAVDPMGDLVKALAEGAVEQGQLRPVAGVCKARPRGAPVGHLPATAFINANQTHDQIGNRAQGERLLTLADPAAMRIAHAMLLTAPYIPMLFMGEEAGETAPFQYFVDFQGDLAKAVRNGRAAEFKDFDGFDDEVPDPNALSTFEESRPFRGPFPPSAEWRALTRQALELRAARVVPLLKSGRTAPTRVVQTGRRSLTAQWSFAAGTLCLRANLGAQPDAPPLPAATDMALGDIAHDPHAFSLTVTAR